MSGPIAYDPVRMPTRLTGTLLALAGAGLLAACGGGGDSGGESENVGDNAAYSGAYDICVAGIESTASDYAIEPTKEAVINLVIEQISGGRPEDETAARQGCADGLAKAPRKDQ